MNIAVDQQTAAQLSQMQQLLVQVQTSVMQLHGKVDQVGMQVVSQGSGGGMGMNGMMINGMNMNGMNMNMNGMNMNGMNNANSMQMQQMQQQMQLMQQQMQMGVGIGMGVGMGIGGTSSGSSGGLGRSNSLISNGSSSTSASAGGGGVGGQSAVRVRGEDLVGAVEFIVQEYESILSDKSGGGNKDKEAVAKLEEKVSQNI